MKALKSSKTGHLLTFKNWIDEYGSARLAKELDVHLTTVGKWLRGHCPRPEQMTKIKELSGGRVDYTTIVEGVQEVRR